MGVIVSVPVWRSDYVRTFRRVMLPALLPALSHACIPVTLVLHTDAERDDLLRDVVLPALVTVELRPVPQKPTYVTLQESHADAVRQAAVGDVVILLNADIVISRNFVTYCVGKIMSGMEAVVLLGIRTPADDLEVPPVDVTPEHLLAWAWMHRHRIIRDLEWPHGQSMLPTNLFWEAGGSVVARGFHLHPAAILKKADTSFRSTIDGDLLDCYPREKIHVVVSPTDCAMCEVSPPDKRFPIRPSGGLTPQRVAASMRTRASAMHCWLFTHRIIVVGDGTGVTGDDVVVQDTLAHLARGVPDEPSTRGPRTGAPGGRRGRR